MRVMHWEGTPEEAFDYLSKHISGLQSGVVMSQEEIDTLFSAAVVVYTGTGRLIEHLRNAYARIFGITVVVPGLDDREPPSDAVAAPVVGGKLM